MLTDSLAGKVSVGSGHWFTAISHNLDKIRMEKIKKKCWEVCRNVLNGQKNKEKICWSQVETMKLRIQGLQFRKCLSLQEGRGQSPTWHMTVTWEPTISSCSSTFSDFCLRSYCLEKPTPTSGEQTLKVPRRSLLPPGPQANNLQGRTYKAGYPAWAFITGDTRTMSSKTEIKRWVSPP